MVEHIYVKVSFLNPGMQLQATFLASKPLVSLGSLGLKQYEQVVLKTGDVPQKDELLKDKAEVGTVGERQGE